ncbi:MAG: hypothetical protein KA369_09800 [Spirochaetes bacterium]|nr:hypothetical protein [Spirochaetota bacterium]
MKRVLTLFLGTSCIVFSAVAAFAYNTQGVMVWPVPFYPGSGIVQITDLQALALEAMGYPSPMFNKVKVNIYTVDGEDVNGGVFPGYPAVWTGRDRHGNRVEPGMYVMRVESEDVRTGLRGSKTVRVLARGRSRGTFTRGGWVGGKYVAMGRNGEVTADDVFSIYWNPAGLTELRHTQFLTEKEIKDKARKGKVEDISESDLIRFSEEERSFTVQAALSGSMLTYGTNTAFFGMAINLPKGVLGLGAYTVFSGGIDRRDYNNLKTGSLGYLATAGYLSYGVSLGVTSFGFSVKGLYERIGNDYYLGCGADIGTQVYLLPFLKVGLVVQDLGTGMYPMVKRAGLDRTYAFAYPTLKLGIALITNRNFTLAVSGTKKLDVKTFGYSVGAQYDVMKWASIYIGIKDLVFSAGLTFHVVQFDVSYAFTMDTITRGFNHIASVKVTF